MKGEGCYNVGEKEGKNKGTNNKNKEDMVLKHRGVLYNKIYELPNGRKTCFVVNVVEKSIIRR